MTLQQTYDQLIQRYGINTAGETVTEFSDKGTVHSYIDFYDQILTPYRNYARLLEIGVMTGASLLLWDTWFDAVELTGIDLRPGFNQRRPWHDHIETADNIELRFGVDSTKSTEVTQLWDIIIDDGSHDPADQCATFDNYFRCVAPHGVYVIEDIVDATAMAQVRDHVERALEWSLLAFEDGPRVTITEFHGHRAGRKDDQCLWIQLR